MKYSLTTNKRTLSDGIILCQIKAERDIERFGVKKGDLGGWIEKTSNLSYGRDCWVTDNACVYGDAWVFGDAWIGENAQVYGHAYVYGHAQVFGYTRVYGDARVYGYTLISEDARALDDIQSSKNVKEENLIKIIDSRDEIDLLLDCIER